MHFHAYIPYILHILIYWLWLVLLCMSLSPPPPLSLSLVYVSCVMAPKWKFTPSRNPLCFGASTSSDLTPSYVRFRDEKAKSNFFESFSRQGIHLECQVILSDFSNTNLLTIIHSRGWESLCDVPVICPSVLIQEFYFNMHRFDYYVPLFVTWVWGMGIVVTPNIVFKVLHFLRVVHLNYPSCECLRIVSKAELIFAFCERPSDWGDR